MTETWIWDPGQEDDTRSSDGTGARCCTLPHPQKTVDLALRPVQAGNPTNRVPGNSVVARVSLGQCGGVCDGTQWAAGRALPRSPAAPAEPTLRPSVPRKRLGPPQGDSATKSALVPNLQGTNQPRGDQPRRPLQRATPAATTTATAATRKKQFGTNRGERRTARTTATRPGRITARLAAGGPSRAPRSPRVDSAAKFALVPNLQGTNQPRRVRR